MLTLLTCEHVNIVNMARPEKIPETSTEQRDTYHHGDLKRALTEAALGLVKEKGPKGFTLREVARRAGVSAAAPYRHFSDKAQLLAAVATQGFIQLHEALSAAAAETADLTRQVLDMGRAYARWAVTHPDYYQVMFGAETGQERHSPSCSPPGHAPSTTCSTPSFDANRRTCCRPATRARSPDRPGRCCTESRP